MKYGRLVRFSMRFLIASVTVLAIALAYWTNDVRQHNLAIVAIRGMGGRFTYDDNAELTARANRWLRSLAGYEPIDRVTAISFQGAHGKRWTQEEMRLYGANATAGQLSEWEPWTQRNVLSLKPHLESLNGLDSLSFYGTVIPRGGLAAVAQLYDLHYLDLEQTQITDGDLQHLRDLASLRTLRLRRTRIRNEGIEELSTLQGLRSLDLGSTGIGDDGLVKLKELRTLEDLSLQNTNITDEGLVHLREFASLKRLDIRYTDVTRRGYAQISLALPGCNIRWRGKKH